MSEYELPLREWIVIFYPTTGSARLCPTIDFARNICSSAHSFVRFVYKSANDFRIRHDHAFLEKCWVELHKTVSWRFPKSAVGSLDKYSPTPPDVDTERFSKMLWEFIQDVGDRLTVPRIDTDKSKQHYELRMGEIHKLVNDEEAFKEKYNKQARAVLRALFDNGEQFLTEEEIKKLIYKLVADRQLKTKQTPWIIFQYYRPEFIRDGYVIRGRNTK